MACGQPDGAPLPSCSHSRLERHESVPVMLHDRKAIDPDPDRVSESRTITKPLPPMMGGAVEVDLADVESAAQFLEMVARVIRERRRIRITIE